MGIGKLLKKAAGAVVGGPLKALGLDKLAGGLLGGQGGMFSALLGLVGNMIVPGAGSLLAGAGSLFGATAASGGVADMIGAGMSSLMA